jgi:hypothetical protein
MQNGVCYMKETTGIDYGSIGDCEESKSLDPYMN